MALEQRGSYRSAWRAFHRAGVAQRAGGPEMEAIGDNFSELGSQKTETLTQLEEEEILGASEGNQKAEWLRLAGHVGVSGKAANLLSIRLVMSFVALMRGWIWGSHGALREREHINLLELRAILRGLQWRARTKRFCSCRFLHFADSQICLVVLCKGRPTAAGRSIESFAKSAHSA